MKKYFFRGTLYISITLIVFIFISCRSNKNITKQTSKQQVKTETVESFKFTPVFRLSPSAKIFLKDVEDEINEGSFGNYIPSSDLIERYGFRNNGVEYVINGSITVTSEFSDVVLKNKGVDFGRKRGDNITVSIPFSVLDDFLHTENIIYFQIAEQVKLK